jgi:hypothetical protein
MNLILVEPLDALAVPSATADAVALRDSVVLQAKEIEVVVDAFDAVLAANAMRACDKVIKAIEVSHKEAKAPFLELTRQLDALKREMGADIEVEKARLSRLLGAWQAGEREKQKLAEAEARRIALEEVQKAANAKAIASQDFTKSELEIAEEVASIDQQTQIAVAQLAEDVKSKHQAVKGIKARKKIRWEIIDGKALAEGCPRIVQPDNCLDSDCPSPLKARINALISIDNPLPGTRVWEETIATL